MEITYSNLLMTRTSIHSQMSLKSGYFVHFTLELLALESILDIVPCIGTLIFSDSLSILLITRKILKSKTHS